MSSNVVLKQLSMPIDTGPIATDLLSVKGHTEAPTPPADLPQYNSFGCAICIAQPGWCVGGGGRCLDSAFIV